MQPPFCPEPRHTRQPPEAEGLLCTSGNPETSQTFLFTEKPSSESRAGHMGPLCEIPLPLSASRATTWGSHTDSLAPPVSQGPMGISRGSTLPQRPFARCGAAGSGSEHLTPLSPGAGTRQFPKESLGFKGWAHGQELPCHLGRSVPGHNTCKGPGDSARGTGVSSNTRVAAGSPSYVKPTVHLGANLLFSPF